MSQSNQTKDNHGEQNPNQDGSHNLHPSISNQDNESSDRTRNQINVRQFTIPQRRIIRAPSLSSRGGRGGARGSGRGGRGNNSFKGGLTLLANVTKNIQKIPIPILEHEKQIRMLIAHLLPQLGVWRSAQIHNTMDI